jgi:hypothetical protein
LCGGTTAFASPSARNSIALGGGRCDLSAKTSGWNVSQWQLR